MKRFLSALVILSILIAALPALAQGETLDKTYVSHDDVFTFDYPGEWKFAVDIDGTAVVWNKNTTVYVYGPEQVAARNWGMGEPVATVERIMTRWSRAGDEVSAVQELPGMARAAALGYYVHDAYPGLLMIVELSDGSLGGIEAVGTQGERVILGEDMALAIAETLDVMPGAMHELNAGDLNGAWLEAINELTPGSN
jgi:hypothetical protein